VASRGGGHAVILTDIEKQGDEDNYTVTIVDSNGPQITTMNCGFATNVISLYHEDGSFAQDETRLFRCKNLYESNGEEYHFVPLLGTGDEERALELQDARADYCSIGADNDDEAVCDTSRTNGTWIENNFPLIDNFLTFQPENDTDQPVGNCAGWANFVLRVNYLGNFVGECPAP